MDGTPASDAAYAMPTSTFTTRSSCRLQSRSADHTAGPSSSSAHAAECSFHFTALLRGGDAVSLERLSTSSELHERRQAARKHKVAEADRVKARMMYGTPPETRLRVVSITGDGRCLFRALAKGLAHGKGEYLGGSAEEADADELRRAVADALCRGPERLKQFKEVVPSIEAVEGGLGRYCSRLQAPSFWGGEVEILVLSRMLHAPIYVYRSAQEAGRKERGYVPIVKYGEEFEAGRKGKKPRTPVKLLYSGGNHYDLLLPGVL